MLKERERRYRVANRVRRKGETRVCTICVTCVRCINVANNFLELMNRLRSMSIHNFLRQTFTVSSSPVKIRVEHS